MRERRPAVVVSGGSRGIGAAIVCALAARGWPVALAYRQDGTAAEAVVEQVRTAGGRAFAMAADVTDADQTARIVSATCMRYGELHGVVHCAGLAARPERFRHCPWESFEAHWRVQVQGAYHLVRGALPRLIRRKRGVVVLVVSAYVFGAPPAHLAPYVTAKHALEGLGKALAVELAPRGIAVHMVSPTLTRTAMTAHLPEAFFEAATRDAPGGRLATPEDTAAVVSALLELETAAGSGNNLLIAGGP